MSFRALTQYWITNGRGIRANAARGGSIEGYSREEHFRRNLDFNTSEEDVRQLFAAYGQVDRVIIVSDRDTDQPRGFGFVEMASSDEGKKAIAALNGTLLGDRALNVNDARPRPGRGGGGREGRERRRTGGRW